MCDNIKVAIKVRPLLQREKEAELTSLWRIKDNTIAAVDPNSFSEPYCFDHIFDETKSTQSLFEIVAKPIIENCMKGINGTIFAYGQTSSGKTHTMIGTGTDMGVIPLSIHQIFHEIESMAPQRQFLLRIAYIEIYNEKIYDLLDGKLSELKIRDTQNEAKVKCHEIIVNSPESILHYLAEGNAAKRMEETNMNERSSRSHTIFRITIESRALPNESDGNDESVVQISNLNLVDLAGSEKADQTGTTGARLKEGAYINLSLFSLGFVIKQLSEKGPDAFINYRDSKLTRILQASLGGNSMTSIICTITPATVDETNYTLLFATRAKTIKNKPIINETISEATAMRRLNKEISRLKEQLHVEKQKNSKFRIEQLERDINERETKFVGSYTMRNTDKTRRRTWCPSSTHVNELSVVYEEKDTGGPESLRPVSELGGLPNVNLDRESPMPFETLNSRDFDLIDDMFLMRPLEDNLSFGTSSEQSLTGSSNVMTPLAFIKLRNLTSNKCTENCQCDRLERELNDLKEFTRLEKKFDSKSCTDISSRDYEELKTKLFQKGLQLEVVSSRNSELEFRLETKITSITKMEKDLEKITNDLNEAIKSKDYADQARICAQYEYEQLKIRTARREKELIDMIEEYRNYEDSAKIKDRIQGLEDKINEMRNQNQQLETDITNEKLKYESLEKIRSQLITDLDQEKSKLQSYMSETKNSVNLLEENNLKLQKDLENAKFKLKSLVKENQVLCNELENKQNALLINKEERCDKCVELTNILDTEQLRYSKLKQDFDSLVSSDLQEIQNVVLTLQHYLKSLASDEFNGIGSGKENRNINDYIKDLKTICSSTSYVLTEKYSSNANLNQSIEEFSAADLGIKNSSFNNLSAREELVIETLQNRTLDLENQIMKISNQLNKEFDTKAMQTDWRFDEFAIMSSKYSELQALHKKLQSEYDEISTGLMDWIQENEEIKKQLAAQEKANHELNEKYKALLIEKKTLDEHKELGSLRANYEEAVKFNQSLQENLNDYSTLKSKYDNLFEEKQQLEEQLSEKKAEIELLLSIERKYDQLLTDKACLEQRFVELLNNAESETTDSVETLTTNESLEKQDEKSRKESLNELNLLQLKYNDLVRENQMALDKYNELLESNKSIQQSFEALAADHESVNNSLIQISEKCTAVEKHRDFIKFKYGAIIKEYKQLFSSFSANEVQLDSLEKETSMLKEELAKFESIQGKYENLRGEKGCHDKACGVDDSETGEVIAKKLADEIAMLSDKFEAVLSERNLVEANFEVLRTEYHAAKELLEIKVQELETIRQKYEDVLVEKLELQQTIEQLTKKTSENLEEYEKQKFNYEEQLSGKTMEYNELLSENQEYMRRIEDLVAKQISPDVIEGLQYKIQKLEHIISDLNAERDGRIAAISILKSELNSLNDKYDKLTQKYAESEKLLNESQEKLKSLQQNMTTLQSKNEALEQEAETLKSDLMKACAYEKKYSSSLIEKQILEKQIIGLGVEVNKHERKIQELQAAHEELQKEKIKVQEEERQLRDKITGIELSKLEMEQQLRAELVAEREKFEKDLQASNDRLEEFKWNLQQADTSKTMELDSVRQLFDMKYKELLQSKETLESELKSELTWIQGDYKKLEKSEQMLKFELKSLETEKANLKNRLTELQEAKSSTEKELKSQLNIVEKDLEKTKSALDHLRKGKSLTEQELGTQYNELKQKYTEMEKNLKSELNAIKQKYASLQKTIDKLTNVQDKYNKLQSKFEELETTKAMMEKNINSVQQNSDRMQITIKSLEQNKVTVEQKCTQLQCELNIVNERQTLLLAEKTELERSVASSETENKILKQSKQDLEVLLKKQAAQIYEINTRLTESETKQAKLKLDYETFEQKSKSLQIELDTLKTQSKSLADYSSELREKSKRIEILENKKKELLAQLHELQNMHLFKTNQFENELKSLKTKLEESNMRLMQTQKTLNISKNKLLNENSDLKKKNQSLFFELDEIKRKQNDRKLRRSITYDNNRSDLLDMQTVGVMTDRTDSNCNCDIMNEKIMELTRENYIKGCHITNYQIKEKNNPLIMECEELREKLTVSENNVIDLERQLIQVNIKLRKARDKSARHSESQTPTRPEHKTIGTNTDTIRTSPAKPKSESVSVNKPKPLRHVETSDRLVQTEFVMNQDSTDELHTTIRQLDAEVRRLRLRYEESKCLAIARRRKIDLLNEELAKLQRGS